MDKTFLYFHLKTNVSEINLSQYYTDMRATGKNAREKWRVKIENKSLNEINWIHSE